MSANQNSQNPHDGHRQKMRDKYLEYGIESFQPHEILEILLFYAVPRKNTNLIAHNLIDKLGTISGVLEAPYDLLKEYGLTDNAVFLLKMLPDLLLYCKKHDNQNATFAFDSENFISSVSNQFLGKSKEMTFLILYNPKLRPVYNGMLNTGTFNKTDLNITRICELAVQYKAAYVVLAHNHPSGSPLPSNADIISTIYLKQALNTLRMSLLDHFAVTDTDCTSMASSQLLFNSVAEYKKSPVYPYYSQF